MCGAENALNSSGGCLHQKTGATGPNPLAGEPPQCLPSAGGYHLDQGEDAASKLPTNRGLRHTGPLSSRSSPRRVAWDCYIDCRSVGRTRTAPDAEEHRGRSLENNPRGSAAEIDARRLWVRREGMILGGEDDLEAGVGESSESGMTCEIHLTSPLELKDCDETCLRL